MLYQKMKSHHAKHGHYSPGGFGRWGKHQNFRSGGNYPPVNVEELDDRYELFLYAAGFSKSDFQISLVDNILTVKVKNQENQEEKNWSRQEFSSKGFERKFELNEKIDSDKIEAKYTNGVLQLTLAKIEGSETIRTEIDIV